MLLLLLLLLIVPLLLFAVISGLKWYQIKQLIKTFKPLNPTTGSIPIQFSWLDVLFPQYSPSNLLLFSSNESIFQIRSKYSRNKPVYVTYSWRHSTIARSLVPFYVVITDLQVAKQVLEDSETWVKYGRQNIGVLASLMSLACTSMSTLVVVV